MVWLAVASLVFLRFGYERLNPCHIIDCTVLETYDPSTRLHRSESTETIRSSFKCGHGLARSRASTTAVVLCHLAGGCREEGMNQAQSRELSYYANSPDCEVIVFAVAMC